MVLFGVTWILAFIADVVDSAPMDYVAVIVNGLQGVFLFVAFCLNDRVRALWRRTLARAPCRKVSGRAGPRPGDATSDSLASVQTASTDTTDTKL